MCAMQINVITREDWGARKPKEDLPLFDAPAKNVLMTLKTDFGECHTREECTQKCQAIQNQHMDEWGLPDIAYNFLFGNDGNVYEGRGWDFKPQRAVLNFDHGPKTYNIALIGDYRAVIPNSIHIQMLSWEDYGEQFRKLDVEGYFTYPCLDNKKSFDPVVIRREHEEFLNDYPDIARVYGRVPDIKFNVDEIMKQIKGKKVRDSFPYIPIN